MSEVRFDTEDISWSSFFASLLTWAHQTEQSSDSENHLIDDSHKSWLHIYVLLDILML